jgi:hypothetical protein
MRNSKTSYPTSILIIGIYVFYIIVFFSVSYFEIPLINYKNLVILVTGIIFVLINSNLIYRLCHNSKNRQSGFFLLVFQNVVLLFNVCNLIFEHYPRSWLLYLCNGLVIILLIYIYKNNVDAQFINLENSSIFFETGILIILFLMGYYLRVFEISKLGIYYDEFYHLGAIKKLINGDTNDYSRGFLTVTLPATIIIKYLAGNLVQLRFFSVAMNLFAIIPLYKLLKNFGKILGFIGVALYVTDPIIISQSQWIREYASSPLIFYFGLLMTWNIFDVTRDYSANITGLLKNNKFIYSLLCLFTIIIYYFFIDRWSTLKLTGAILAGLLVMIFLFPRIIKIIKDEYVFFGFLIFFGFAIITTLNITNNQIVENITNKVVLEKNIFSMFSYFNTRLPFHWDYKYLSAYSILFIGLFTLTTFKIRNTYPARFIFYLMVIFWTLISLNMFLIFELQRYRYLHYVELMYIIALSIGIFYLTKWVTNNFSQSLKVVRFLVPVYILLSYINLPAVYKKIDKFYSYPFRKYHPITQELYLPYSFWWDSVTKLDIKPDDIFVTAPTFGNYVDYMMLSKSHPVYLFDPDNENFWNDVHREFSKSKSGWFLIEFNFYANNLPKNNADICFSDRTSGINSSECIHYVDNYKGLYVYHWE